MTPPSDRERILCAMFESFCVAAIRNFGRNLRRAMRNHQKYDGNRILVCVLSALRLCVWLFDNSYLHVPCIN